VPIRGARLRSMMERSEIAEIICEALYTGHFAASLASVVDDQATWTLISGSSQQQTSSDSSPSANYFQGFVGLRGIANFCRAALQIASGDLTGCVIRGDCLFAFGTLRLQAAPNKKLPETNFAGKLGWSNGAKCGARILLHCSPTTKNSGYEMMRLASGRRSAIWIPEAFAKVVSPKWGQCR
jgi:hypothetical protein